MQILNIIQLEYLVIFIRAKINKLDRVRSEQNADPEAKKANLLSTTAKEGLSCFYLGASEPEPQSLSKFAESGGFLVPGVPNLLEAFVNRFRTVEEGYYKVQGEDMVIRLSCLRLSKTNIYNMV